MNPFQQHGAFSWCELIAPDIAAAKEFYGQLFGWTLKEGAVGNVPYTVIEAGGREIGGMAPPPPPAKALGGQVLMPPMEVEATGKFSLIKDPQGATFCAIEYSQPS